MPVKTYTQFVNAGHTPSLDPADDMGDEFEEALIEEFRENGEVDSIEYSGGEGLDAIITCTFAGFVYWTKCWRDNHGDLYDIGEHDINVVTN